MNKQEESLVLDFQIKYDYGLDDEERQAVQNVLQNDAFITRDQCTALEEEFAKFIGTKFAIVTFFNIFFKLFPIP